MRGRPPRFRNTIGLRGRMSVRLQPNHPFDDAKGITASILDGMLLGSGDACIGINPASDDPAVIGATAAAARRDHLAAADPDAELRARPM